jgi:prolyl 4-hydroxylase
LEKKEEKSWLMDYLIVNNFLTKERCQELITLSENAGYDEADISYATGAQMNKEYRDNSRCLIRDEELRLELEALILPHVPMKLPIIKPGGVIEQVEYLKLSGNFRFYKYAESQKFKKHRDGNIAEEGGVSRITVLIYLNDVEKGGETNICDRMLDKPIVVKPEEGKLLLFNHTLLHSGEELLEGIKYVLRTDLIYNA